MKNFFIACLVSSLIYACADKDKLPKGVLPKQQMREVMWDMIRAGEFLNGFVFNKDSSLNKIAESEKWYEKIYQLHKISKAEFEKSYAYYNGRPALMKEILDSLAKRQVYVKPVVRDSTAVKDSINKKVNSTPTKDTLRRSRDSLRKKIIKMKKSLYKPV